GVHVRVDHEVDAKAYILRGPVVVRGFCHRVHDGARRVASTAEKVRRADNGIRVEELAQYHCSLLTRQLRAAHLDSRARARRAFLLRRAGRYSLASVGFPPRLPSTLSTGLDSRR